jgi:putative transposase
MNSEPDHVHLLVSIPSTISIADLINAFKSNSTRWIRQTFSNRKWFSWQEGYAAFSVSRSQEQAVVEYIRNQHEHHLKSDFQQELLELLRYHEIVFDLKYVFD